MNLIDKSNREIVELVGKKKKIVKRKTNSSNERTEKRIFSSLDDRSQSSLGRFSSSTKKFIRRSQRKTVRIEFRLCHFFFELFLLVDTKTNWEKSTKTRIIEIWRWKTSNKSTRQCQFYSEKNICLFIVFPSFSIRSTQVRSSLVNLTFRIDNRLADFYLTVPVIGTGGSRWNKRKSSFEIAMCSWTKLIEILRLLMFEHSCHHSSHFYRHHVFRSSQYRIPEVLLHTERELTKCLTVTLWNIHTCTEYFDLLGGSSNGGDRPPNFSSREVSVDFRFFLQRKWEARKPIQTIRRWTSESGEKTKCSVGSRRKFCFSCKIFVVQKLSELRNQSIERHAQAKKMLSESETMTDSIERSSKICVVSTKTFLFELFQKSKIFVSNRKRWKFNMKRMFGGFHKSQSAVRRHSMMKKDRPTKFDRKSRFSWIIFTRNKTNIVSNRTRTKLVRRKKRKSRKSLRISLTSTADWGNR